MENLENKVERAEPGWDEFVKEHEMRIYDAKGRVPWIKKPEYTPYKNFPINSNVFKKPADEPDCGISCPLSGQWSSGPAAGKVCDPDKAIKDLLMKDSNNNIVMGRNAAPQEIPWQVSLRHYTG